MYYRARTKEQVDERKKEIILALDELYMNKEWDDIFLKDIAKNTSISRTAIYSYYKSKEEILLDSLYYHFIELDDGLEKYLPNIKTKEEVVKKLTSLLKKNISILKIMSSNLEVVERNVPLENLIILKKELKRFYDIFSQMLRNISPSISEEKQQAIYRTFIALLYGFYPLSYPISVQKEAMKQVGFNLSSSIETMISDSLNLLFASL